MHIYCNVLISIFCLYDIITRLLSMLLLQTNNLDVFSATIQIKELKAVLGHKRENVDLNNFDTI